MHKASPFVDQVIARLLITHPEVKVILVGDHYCKLLEGASWKNEPRVLLRSGEWEIRQSLAFAQIADLVVGSETGLLNSVGLEDVPKVIALSHSTKENLTRHWKNTTVLTPKVDCYPCHKLHYGKGDCPWEAFGEIPADMIGKNGITEQDKYVTAPACTVDITADHYYTAIRDIIRLWQRPAATTFR